MFAEDFFEYIVANFGEIILLIICLILSAILWTLPFVIMFLPLYFEDIVERLKDFKKRSK